MKEEITISRLAGLLGITPPTVLRRVADGRLTPPSDPKRLAWRVTEVRHLLAAEAARLRARVAELDSALLDG